jgi:two-component system nitrogen regulation response regulator GlnG
MQGELIGINSAIISRSGGNVGIGFAVPTEIASSIMGQILDFGEIRRGLLGVNIQTVDAEAAKTLGIDVEGGALVTRVFPESAAENAGLEVGDIIVEVNDKKITGAAELRRGRFEQADGGTLFLDEIGDMSPALQTRLLRVLAEGEFYRVGGQMPVRVDVRVIAATHQDLEQRVGQGLFREDLLHRLNVIRIEVPPLRQRREDIPELLQHYLDVAAMELGVAPKVLASEAQRALISFDWPGNVRQLVNACRRLTVLAAGREIAAEDIPSDLGGAEAGPAGGPDWTQSLASWAQGRLAAGGAPLLEEAMPEFERTLIREALKATHGGRQEAARLLGWGRNTLTRKLKELGM